MSNLLAVVIGALVGVGGVIAGTWLQSQKEHQRWLRDQKLRAATVAPSQPQRIRGLLANQAEPNRTSSITLALWQVRRLRAAGIWHLVMFQLTKNGSVCR